MFGKAGGERGAGAVTALWYALARFPGGVAQLVERLTGSQEVRGFESLRLHQKSQVRVLRFLRRSEWIHPCENLVRTKAFSR